MELLAIFQEIPTVFYITVAIFSLCVGSFLNVVIYRLPIIMENDYKKDYHEYFYPNESPLQLEPFTLSTPASTCPKCKHQIRWYENIPIISWVLLLRGKCSQCQLPISIRYPFVEFATMLLSLVVVLHFGVSLQAVFGVILTWFLVALTGIDFDKQLLPDCLVFPLLGLGMAVNSVGLYINPIVAIWGALIGFVSLWSVNFIFKLIRGYDGMGKGDFKLLAALGAWSGLFSLPLIIFLSAIVGSIIGIILKYTNNGKSVPFAFGPYLAIAGWITFLYGDKITKIYFDFIKIN